MSGIVYLNGEYLPAEEARVPVLDRGFIFGDGVYEVIPAYNGKLFRLDEHLQRLDDSLTATRITNPYSNTEWRTILETLLEKNGDGDQSVYLQVTRGIAVRDHGFPEKITPTVFVMCNPLKPVDNQVREQGVCAITLEDTRWKHCNIKAITLLPNILLRQEAVDAGCAEAILIRDGLVTEGAASNVFVVHDGRITTPPKSRQLLPGITRDLVVELANKHGLDCVEEDIPVATLTQADEIWLTSSTREILPVTRLDDQPVGDGRPGPVWAKMFAIYQDYKQALRRA
ncbi:MAG TPA: D-amino acid aminotransferase [Gammaproteobacteria bacterium]|nr:D-amino acid aminotransferase [Gammaproteobacteria bacterium]